MGLATFKGGIHPYDGKELSEDKSIMVVHPKGEMVFPLSQHIGAPAKSLVTAGEQVLVGQKIGEADGLISACVISSVSGKVKAIESRRVANGTLIPSVIVENDGMYHVADGYGKGRDYKTLSKEEIRTMIKEAGIVGLGGAGFPSHVKLAPKDESKINTVIVNGAECEPYLTSDYRLMLEEPESIIKGLNIILHLFERARGVIAIESNKPEAVKRLTALVKDEPRITVCPLQTKYPQGGERTLIYAVTGRKINSSMLPADAGCIVDNVDTVISIYNAVAKGIPLIRRIITVTGDAVKNPGNFHVRTGTSYRELIEACGGFRIEPQKMVSGGPMMGHSLFDINIPVTKVSSSLTCLTKDEAVKQVSDACIRCGRCVNVCPGNIVPVMLMETAKRFDLEQFVKLNGMECCECGCCGYICPAEIPLTQAFKEMRRQVAASRQNARRKP
ncbi:electron transport complex subunit RsxC [Clostridium sp. HBUAS56010]|uniref:electron transport complex subunit RsxC n=1 Tax=Clostridium sp. HBUAS56010 TaxID=2571127 RepID=UPI001177F12C|nr:electron transport complex subunit RsxC [Clostridium sp. HBUAS56010]